jgi:hypothetical protein
MSNDSLDPATLALLDQVLAGSVEYLDGLVKAYQDTLMVGREEGSPDVMTVVACAATLKTELPPEILAGTLAVAVMRLAGEECRCG